MTVIEIVIDREERRNALDRAEVARLRAALQAAADDDTVRAVVIAGAGTRSFCAGQDIKELAELTLAERLQATVAGQRLMDEIEAHPCLVIAAIEGYCLGGGLELALACDARVCGSEAVFGLPEVTRDLLPTWGGLWRLSRAIGLGRAQQVALLGQRLDAGEAVAAGLVMESVATGSAQTRAVAVATEATAQAGRRTLAKAKALLHAGAASHPHVARLLDELAETSL
jgi:enoyl-CoA hydratase/carnithine racemase